jgi:hypothetical protein
MFGWDDILGRIREKPFRPFRIIAGEGQRFDIHHPDLVLVGQRDLIIGHPGPENPAVYDGVTRVALLHVVAMEDLSINAPKSNGSTETTN